MFKGIINSAQNIVDRQKDEGITTKSFAFNKRLRELYLSGNPIGDSGATALAAALKTSSRIKQYHNDNDDDEEEEEQPSTTTTPFSPVIETLDISSCTVGDIGAEALAIAIVCNIGCIQNLNLSNNVITDTGAIALAKALINCRQKQNTLFSIDCLDLSNNMDIWR